MQGVGITLDEETVARYEPGQREMQEEMPG
jgi:hypothetical protein